MWNTADVGKWPQVLPLGGGSNSPPLGFMLAFQDRHQQAVQDGAE